MYHVLRNIDREDKTNERCIKVILCEESVTGKALSDKILHCILGELGLDITNCRGQLYDGAANMARKYSRVAAHILNQTELAIYMHCASHRLTLCVAPACQLQTVKPGFHLNKCGRSNQSRGLAVSTEMNRSI